MKNIIYYNLSQCAGMGRRYVYFRSTDVEQMNYHRLLWSVPDEWLYFMHKKLDVVVYDISSNSRGKIERIFIPTLQKLLIDLYGIDKTVVYPKEHLAKAKEALEKDKMLLKKYKFWKDKINHVEIKAVTLQRAKEVNPLKKG